MNLPLKILNCHFYLIILLFLFRNVSSSTKSRVTTPISVTISAPNGPVDLPFDKKLNLGLRKYKYNLPDESEDSDIQNEMKEDAEELTDVINKTNIPGWESYNYPLQDEMHYDMSPWLVEMIRLSDKSKNTLESLGLENLPDVNTCKRMKHLQEQMLCILDAKDITSLTARVLAGGRLAVRALSRLKTLASTFENRQLMKKLGTQMATLILLQRETTSDRNRWLCGSIFTLLTDLPVVTDLADVNTGSYGHVNVIMPRQSRIRDPDRSILKLREGASPSSLISGYTTR
ncbi:conserved Plasmodium protein, unknown function [Plasmodium ovale curtisi]|uniref:Uncharacterized protein n=2 Tax=Plasmodium ovale curtisi TaxID=864141 RepID=A0A1A8VVU3_PLAOA|nr:conserved Plasmodium protein, unknown function [Plasmodium ovale curtisi]